MLSAGPHLAIEDWLQNLGLICYLSLFTKYSGVEDILHLSEKELKAMGIRNGSHRANIASSLHALKEKYKRAHKSRSPNASMSSLKAESSKIKSVDSISPISRSRLDLSSSGVRSWPTSGTSSLTHTRHSSHRASMEGSFGIDASPSELKRALERELSLDASDLRSYAWYHGTILRKHAEELVGNAGDFLVRDCISQPGDFVITCKWDGLPLHFIINKVILQPHTVYEKVQYCFENDSFDSISDFITYHVGSKCPLSSCSAAVILNPVNRSMPLSYYASRYGTQCQIHYAAKALEKLPISEKESPDSEVQLLPSPSKCVASEDVDCRDGGPLTDVQSSNERKKLVKVGSDPNLNPNTEKRVLEHRPNSGIFATDGRKEIESSAECDKPPPKPSRVPSRKYPQRPLVVKRERRTTPPTPLNEQICSGLLSTQSSVAEQLEDPVLDSAFQHGWPIPYKRIISGETRFSFLDRPSVSSEGSLASDAEAVTVPLTLPSMDQSSFFKPSEFHSPLMSPDNKPLELSVLNEVKRLLLNESSKHLACHMTRIDLEISKNFDDEDLGLGVTSGLELILLPQGRQLVKDLLERTDCLKIFVAVTILTCASVQERVKVLNAWIEIALDMKNTLGNFFGFTSVMLGLTGSEVSRLQSTWDELRCSHTKSAFAFEAKLRPAFKAMQESSVKTAPNTCIPYIMSLLSVLEHYLAASQAMSEESCAKEVPERVLDIPGEQNSSDFGMQVLEDILEMSRNLVMQLPVFRSNVEMSVKKVRYDNLLLDIFRTEFHMRMLWGCRGASVCSEERRSKFEKVLQLLFLRCQESS